MRRKVLAVVVVVFAVALVMWRHHRAHTNAPSSGDQHAAGAQLPHAHVPHGPTKPASIAGRVTNKRDGSGIAGAVVAVGRADLGGMIGMSGPPLVAISDATGAWSVPALPPAQYVVSATANGFFPGTSPRLTLMSGEQKSGVDLVLEAGGTLVHGTVTDIGGGPIANARIQIHPDSVRMLDGGQLVALTGADGTYQIAVRDGPYNIAARHDAYAGRSKDIHVAGKPLQVDFTLTPGSIVHGIVIARDTNKPVPHAIIMQSHGMRGGRGMGEPVTTSADDGTFTLTSLEPGATEITAKASGYSTTTPTTVRLGIGEQADGVRVLVDHAFSISGHVVASDTKKGVPGVMVGAFTMSGDAGFSPDPTGEDGSFEVFGLHPGTYLMFALSQEKLPDFGKNVTIVDKDVTDVELDLDNGATLIGRVDPPGAAQLELQLAGDVGIGNIMQAAKAALVHGDADPSGAFKLEHVPSGKFTLAARTTSGPAGTLDVVVTGADQNGLVVKLEPRGAISGTVIDTDNNPVAGIRVSARPGDGEKPKFSMSSFEGTTTTSGPDGTFSLVGLDAGSYKLHAGGWNDMTKQHGDQVNVDLAAAGTKTGVVITIEAKNGVIRGQVLEGNGKPSSDAWVTARSEGKKHAGSGGDDDDYEAWSPSSEPVLSDDAGKFAIRGLSSGTYTVVVEGANSSSRAEQKHVSTGDTVTIQLAPLGTLTGHVTADGNAVTAFDLACRGPAGEVERSFTTADGAYTLDHLAPGSYSCNVSSDGGAGSGSVTVPSDTATLDLSLATWGQITGTVVSAFDGSPVPGLSAVPLDNQGERMTETIMGNGPKTDTDGHFAVGRLQAGSSKLMIFASTSGFTPLATVPYTLTPGQHLDVGSIKVVPPRQGDAGTFGMSVANQNGSVVITSIKPGGPAEAAGLVVGDMILTVDGRAITQLGVDPAVSFLSSGTIGIGTTVQLGLARGGSVTLTSVKW